MSRYNLQKLPPDFRYFLTLKEVKEIEARMGIRFERISTGPINESRHFDKEARFQSSFRALSIAARKDAVVWQFSIHQGGFRGELFPEQFHDEIKKEVTDKMVAYVNKVRGSSLTDGLFHPQLWVYIMFVEGRPKISFNELKK